MTIFRLFSLACGLALMCGAFAFLPGMQQSEPQETPPKRILLPPPATRASCNQMRISNSTDQQSNVRVMTCFGSLSVSIDPITVDAGKTVCEPMPRHMRVIGVADVAPTPPNGTQVQEATGSVYIY